MKKLFLFFIPLMCLSSAFADCDTCCESTCVCEPCDTCCFSPCCCEPCNFVPPCPPNEAAYNAPYIIDVCSCFDVYLTGSFLYWKAYEENIEIGMTDNTTGYSVPILDGNIVGMNFEYKSAFKVGLGFFFGCDNWDFFVEYTRYHPSISGSATSPNGVDGRLFSYWIHPDTDYVSLNGSASWDLGMDNVDFLLRREFWVGKSLTFRPQVGLRASWIDQSYNVTYTSIYNDGYVIDDSTTVKQSADFSGAGFVAGLDTSWMFCGNFRLFGNFLTSIVYADYDISGSQYATVGGSEDIDQRVIFSYSPEFLRSNMELSMGLGWGDYFFCNDWYFDLAVGYNFNVYWNYNAFRRFVDDVNSGVTYSFGDMYIHGLNITAKLHF